jgi:predicted permease
MKASQLAEGGRSFGFPGRKWIVGSQVAPSLVLLVAAGLMLRSFVKLATLDIGFDRNNVLLVLVDLNSAKVPTDRQATTYDEIESRLNALPGVLSVGRSTNTPISGVESMDNSFHTDWVKLPKKLWVYVDYISPGYLPTLRMPLLAGRNFTGADQRNSHAVAIINQTFARLFFPSLNPVGRTCLAGVPAQPVEVVGLIKDPKYYSIREEPRPTAFLPISQADEVFLVFPQTFELRTAAPSAIISAVRAAVARVSSAIPLDFHTLADQVNDSLVQERLLGLLSAFFGALALLLAMIGLYGTFNYLVTQRQTEFGIRMAVGAQPGSILRLVIRDVVAVLTGGLTAGILISLAATPVLQQMLFGLGPRDATTMFLAASVLSAVALLAGYLPARRAAKVDPMAALKYE